MVQETELSRRKHASVVRENAPFQSSYSTAVQESALSGHSHSLVVQESRPLDSYSSAVRVSELSEHSYSLVAQVTVPFPHNCSSAVPENGPLARSYSWVAQVMVPSQSMYSLEVQASELLYGVDAYQGELRRDCCSHERDGGDF